MNLSLLKYRPPRIAMLMLVIAAGLHVAVAGASDVIPAAPVAGLVLGAAGFAVMIWAWWQFRTREVAICPTAPTARLIIDGVYAFTRNPMYLGMVAMMAGIAIAIGSMPFYAAAVVYFAVINAVFCPYEEQKLRGAFGAEYQRYAARVRRWL